MQSCSDSSRMAGKGSGWPCVPKGPQGELHAYPRLGHVNERASRLQCCQGRVSSFFVIIAAGAA